MIIRIVLKPIIDQRNVLPITVYHNLKIHSETFVTVLWKDWACSIDYEQFKWNVSWIMGVIGTLARATPSRSSPEMIDSNIVSVGTVQSRLIWYDLY